KNNHSLNLFYRKVEADSTTKPKIRNSSTRLVKVCFFFLRSSCIPRWSRR
ncbi:unnamed protein product, partial [Arabidopsis halleri]